MASTMHVPWQLSLYPTTAIISRQKKRSWHNMQNVYGGLPKVRLKKKLPQALHKWNTSSTVWISPLSFQDRKSTRLNSSHVKISYAVFCLKKKRKKQAGTEYV